ncbi:hypothetical protein H0H81_001440 [Sphagnurus paluster]|uniref:Uncharacterized protein n=1 Tax=Sphagnurus paluster TaxID=117069 RepID=A0A9P7GMZ8_9AGAR|nr:hypothetical protein H0H81_001440 [Sphagnurus paluster]
MNQAFQAKVIAACTEHEEKNSRYDCRIDDRDYKPCVYIGENYFVKFGPQRDLEPERVTQEFCATSRRQSLALPQPVDDTAVHWHQALTAMLPTHNPDTPSGPSRRLSLFSFRRISGRGLLLLCLFAITVLIWLTAPIPPYHDLSVPRLRPLRPGPGPGPGPGDSETPQPEWAPPDVTSGGNPVYLLRPEVSLDDELFVLRAHVLVYIVVVDGGELVCDVEDHRRGEVARARVGDL